MGSKVNFNSIVPRECQAYHALLDRVSSLQSKPLLALQTLCEAFQFYVEPGPLHLAIELLSPWPDYAQSLSEYASLLYPDVFHLAEQPLSLNHNYDLPSCLNALFFPGLRPRVSLCMIVRDEIETLPSSLHSVIDLVDEKIICDTGSVDGTLDYLRKDPSIISLSFPWQDDYALARNESLAQATGDWILVLDADEQLPDTTIAYLQRFFAFPPLGWQVMSLQVEHTQAHFASSFSQAARVFRRSDLLQFTGAVHEVPIRIKEPLYVLHVSLPVRLKHSGNHSKDDVKQKNHLRLTLLTKILEHSATPYLRYQYAMLKLQNPTKESMSELENQLLMALNATLEYESQAPPFVGWVPAPLGHLIHHLLKLYCQVEDYQKAVDLFSRYGLYWRFSVDYYLLARAAWSLQKWPLVKDALIRCLDLRLPLLSHEVYIRKKALWDLLHLAQVDGALWTLFLVRRLLELDVKGDAQVQMLLALQSELEQTLSLERGTWLDRLHFEIQKQLSKNNLFAVADRVLFALYDSWDKTLLCDAIRVMHVFKQPALAIQIAHLGRCLYPEESLFQVHSQQGLKQSFDTPEIHLASLWWGLVSLPIERPKLSVCMIVRNAEETVLNALLSVVSIADEWVVADTGSVDQTVAVLQQFALEHPLRLLRLDWRNDFSWARNQVLEAADGDWVLFLDADEVLIPESLPQLRGLCAYQPTGLQIFALRCESQHEQSYLMQQDWLPRLFRRHDNIRFWGSVHERPGHAIKAERLPVQPMSQVCLRHTGYLPSAVKKHRKWERNTFLADNLDVGVYPNPYFLFHQGYVLLEEADPASKNRGIRLLEKAKSETLLHQSRPPVAGWFAAPLGKVRLIMFRHWYREQNLSEILRIYPTESEAMNDPEYHFYYAQALLKQGELFKAKETFRLCLSLKPEALPFAGFESWRSLLGLTQVALFEKDWVGGLDLWQELLSLNCPLPVQKIYAEWWQRMIQASDSNKRVSNF